MGRGDKACHSPGITNGGDEASVVSLYGASKRLGMQGEVKRNWTPLLLSLCEQGGIEVRYDESGVPCCRVADIPRLGRLVERYRQRKPMWRRGRGNAGVSSL